MVPTDSGKVRPVSCRDKGRSGVDEGAWCLSWWPDEWSGFPEATRSHPHEDKHKAQYITLKDKRGKEKTRKLPIWQTTRKQKNLKELSDVQITAHGRG